MKEVAPELPRSIPRIAAEAAIYSALVAAYLVLVLTALGPWLRAESEGHRLLYALLCLGLMLGQGIVLELLTTLLMRLFGSPRRGR
jgi:hypothetical protein